MGFPPSSLRFPGASTCSRNKTYKLESLVALQRKSIHQVAGLVWAVWQGSAQVSLAEQRH